MKTFVKKNLVAVFALLVGIGTMSFKMVEKNNATEYWFEVADGLYVTENPLPPNCEDDQGTVCAVAFSQSTLPEGIETIYDAYVHGAYITEAKRN